MRLGIGARDPHEPHRASSPLELLFDLVVVIAVSFAATGLHHNLAEAHYWTGISTYLMVFFALWWAWMNFTWFATSFDADDGPYRIVAMIQMGGALIMAAGIGAGTTSVNFPTIIAGYVVMRVALIGNWLRVASGSPEHRRTALTYAAGIAVVQVGWILTAAFGVLTVPVFLVMALLELAVPAIAEYYGTTTPRHFHHITERYGLFAIIVLGEVILATANSVIEAYHEQQHRGELISIAVAGFVIVCALWWMYFAAPIGPRIDTNRSAMTWGYGHYFIFASAAAISAGLETLISGIGGHDAISEAGARTSLTVAVSLVVVAGWALIGRGAVNAIGVLGGAVLIGASAVLPHGELVAAALTVATAAIWSLSSRATR